MTAPAGKTGNRRESFGAYYFTIEIDGLQEAFFRSCSGLSSESEVQDLAEGGVNTTTHRLIGRTKYPNIVLKQGFTGAVSKLWQLRQKVLKDDTTAIPRFSGSIVQLGPGSKKATWRFVGGWICKWGGPEFDASKNEISIETIEIAHEGFVEHS
jgi:phage tail-like protein